MDQTPLVSICIPTYNRAGMVGKAIESALAQSYPHIEVLVVDNASEDGIEAVVEQYRDPRLSFFKNERNLGLFGNFNRCIELSDGEYIHILHSDDYIDSNFTRTCVEFMESHPGVAMTFTSSQFVQEKGQRSVRLSDQDVIYRAPKGFTMILETRNSIVCPSVMVRKKVYEMIGPFSCEYPFAADLYQWLRIAIRFDIAYIAGAVLFYRMGDHSETYRLLFKSPAGYIDGTKIYMKIIDELGDEAAPYRCELNHAIRGHMYSCLSAAIKRTGLMNEFSPLMLVGLSLADWGLIRAATTRERVKKFGEFIFIGVLAIGLCIPGGQTCLRKISRMKGTW